VGAEVELFDVRKLDLPFFVTEHNPPEAAVRLAEAVYRADGLIWSSPMYHGTISGAFKNALDWLQLLNHHEPPFLTDKAVGLIAAAGGVQGLQAINTMEYVVRSLRGYAVPLVVPIARAGQAFDEQGLPKDPQLATQLRAMATEVVHAARRLRRPVAESVIPTHR
jgi:FMN reductase